MINNKIEGSSTTTHTALQVQMKVISTIDTTLLCGVLDFTTRKYYLDFDDFNKFNLASKKYNFVNEQDIYPSYLYNYKRISLLEHIFSYNSSNLKYNFKNNDPCDLRRNNVEIYHQYHEEVKQKYTILEYIQGHYYTIGNDAFVIKNPMWRIQGANNSEQILMFCEKDTVCILSPESYLKIIEFENTHNGGKKITFYKHHQTSYICCTLNLYIHQIITGCHGNGKGTKEISVDHIDRDPLNNTLENLRVASRDEQEQNSKGIAEGTKRERKSNARELPTGFTQQMMKKYVVYYNECYNNEKKLYREFFKVEKHPKLDKPWISSKSNKVSLQDKLASANKIVTDLEEDIYPVPNATELPTHITIKTERKKPHLVFDKKCEDDKRLNLRMVLPDNYVLAEQLDIFKQKIKTKYDIEI